MALFGKVPPEGMNVAAVAVEEMKSLFPPNAA